jgi:hypothetical protein
MFDHDPDHFRFAEGRDGTIPNDSSVDLSGREGAPREPDLTEEDCQYARWCIENQSTLLDRCKTNHEESKLIQELAAILQATADKWVERKEGR